MDDKIYNIGEFFSSGGATLYKNPSDQTVIMYHTFWNNFRTHIFKKSESKIVDDIPRGARKKSKLRIKKRAIELNVTAQIEKVSLIPDGDTIDFASYDDYSYEMEDENNGPKSVLHAKPALDIMKLAVQGISW